MALNGLKSQDEKVNLKVSPSPSSKFDIKLEKHFCSDCNVDQPVRTKHCKSCGYCVSTCDHHCFWVGNCVGEKNRPLFLFYLNFQVVEMICLLWRPFVVLSQQPQGLIEVSKRLPLLIGLLLLFSLIMIALVSLVVYHYYFLFANITTCKNISK